MCNKLRYHKTVQSTQLGAVMFCISILSIQFQLSLKDKYLPFDHYTSNIQNVIYICPESLK